MMEDKKEDSFVCTCCGAHCHCGNRKHYLLKKIFMLIVLVIVFALGMQLGEIKGELRGGRGFSHHMMYGYGGMPRMMGGYNPNNNLPGSTTSPLPGSTNITPPAKP